MPRPYVPTWGEPEDAEYTRLPVGRAVAVPVVPEGRDSGTKDGPVHRPVARTPRLPPAPPPPKSPTKMGWSVAQAFADALRTERERRGWGMTEFAAHIQIHLSQYRKIENGQTAPTIRLANRLCRRLGLRFALGAYPE